MGENLRKKWEMSLHESHRHSQVLRSVAFVKRSLGNFEEGGHSQLGGFKRSFWMWYGEWTGGGWSKGRVRETSMEEAVGAWMRGGDCPA